MSILTSKPLSAAAILTDSASQAFDSGRNWVRPQNVTTFLVPEPWAGAWAAGLASAAWPAAGLASAAGLVSAGFESAGGAAGFCPGAWTVPVQALRSAALAVTPRPRRKERRCIRTVVIVETSRSQAVRAHHCTRIVVVSHSRSCWGSSHARPGIRRRASSVEFSVARPDGGGKPDVRASDRNRTAIGRCVKARSRATDPVAGKYRTGLLVVEVADSSRRLELGEKALMY